MSTPKFKKFNIEAYKPGKSKINKIKKVIKLSANESALGMSPLAKKAMSKKNLLLDKYPDGKSTNLKMAISKAYKCNFDKIICGAGSDEVIQMLCQLYLNPKAQQQQIKLLLFLFHLHLMTKENLQYYFFLIFSFIFFNKNIIK